MRPRPPRATRLCRRGTARGCSPGRRRCARRGAVPGRARRPACSDRTNPGPSRRTERPSGVGTSTNCPRAASCGSRAHSSAASATRPAATPAACRRAIASSASSVRVHPATCASSSAACATRPSRRGEARVAYPVGVAHEACEISPLVVAEHRDRDPAIVAGAGVHAVRCAGLLLRRIPDGRPRRGVAAGAARAGSRRSPAAPGRSAAPSRAPAVP